jgi:hypothetical protein
MKSAKHTDHKPAPIKHTPHFAGRDFHSAKEKEIGSVKETKHGSKDAKRRDK